MNQPFDTQAWCVQTKTHDLQLTDKALAPLADNEVRIENRAIGLNPVDYKVIHGGVLSNGQIAGVDGAGIITAVGSSSLEHLLGARVAYHQNLKRDGSFAKHVHLQAKVIIPIPEEMDFITAASLPCPLLTAWQAVEKVPAKAGREVLVSGASGSVGRYLIQLLSQKGFQVSVTANPNRHEQLAALGASHCYVMDTQFNERQFFAIFDTRSSDSAQQLAPALQANGHSISIQGRLNTQPLAAFGRCISLHEIALGALHQEGLEIDWLELTQAGQSLLAQIEIGSLIANPVHTVNFDQLSEALSEFEHRRKALKYVVQC